MESKISIKAVSGTKLNEVVEEARRMYPGYNLQTSLAHYIGFCWSVKCVRQNNSMDYKIVIADLIVEAFEKYKTN